MLPEFLDEVTTCKNVSVNFQLAALVSDVSENSDIEQTLFEKEWPFF